MNTIQTEWKIFVENVLPEECSDVQRIEMEKAFYGGATAAISIMMDISEKEVSENAGVEIFQGLIDECRDFSDGLQGM